MNRGKIMQNLGEKSKNKMHVIKNTKVKSRGKKSVVDTKPAILQTD